MGAMNEDDIIGLIAGALDSLNGLRVIDGDEDSLIVSNRDNESFEVKISTCN